MFYDQSSIEQLLKCQNCNQLYDLYEQPRILPCCGKTLCERCIERIEKEVRNNLFKCVMCHDECVMPKKKFPVNELVARLALEQPKEVYRGEVCEEFKINLFNLESLASKLNCDMHHGEDTIKEHCFELRRIIQLATEKKIQEIITSSSLLINRVDDYEQDTIDKYRKNFEFKKMLSDIIEKVNGFIKEQKSYLSQFVINENEIGLSNMKLDALKQKLEENLNIKKTLFNNRLMSFAMNTSPIDESIIGNISFDRIDTTLTKIISTSADETIKIWDFRTGECLKTIEGHTNWVRNAKLMSDDKIISCADDNTIKIWDLASNECIRTFMGHTKQIYSIQLISNDKLIRFRLNFIFDRAWFQKEKKGNPVLLWSRFIETCFNQMKKTILEIGSKIKPVYQPIIRKELKFPLFQKSLSVKNFDSIFKSCSLDKTIKVWSIKTGYCLRTFEGHTDSVYRLEILSNELMISSSGDTKIKVWNYITGDCLMTLTGHTHSVYCVDVISNETIVSGSEDMTIRVWDIGTGECLKTLLGHTKYVWCIRVVNSDQILSGSGDETIKLWSIISGVPLKTFKCHSGIILDIQIISNERMVSASSDKTIKIWDLSTGSLLRTLEGHSQRVISIQVV